MQLKGKTIAVTGATGFLGRYIVRALLRRGARVVGVVRNPQRVPSLIQEGVEMRRADLADRDALARAFQGADALVSNAAMFVVGKMMSFGTRGWEEHRSTNVVGTENVMYAAPAAGVRRIVHVSSVAVYETTFARDISEDAPQLTENSRRTPFNVYQLSKALSEQAAWKIAEECGLQLTTVRPGVIYGAFDPNFMAVVRRLFSLPVTLSPIGFRLPLVYGGDVAEGIALALERPVSIGKAYNLTGEDRPIQEFVRAWRGAGFQAPLLHVPIPIPLVQTLSHERASRDLGWKNRSYEDTLRETKQLEQGGE